MGMYDGTCWTCEKPFERRRPKYLTECDASGRSREPEYCSGKCRQKAYRDRTAAAKDLDRQRLWQERAARRVHERQRKKKRTGRRGVMVETTPGRVRVKLCK